MAEPNTTSKSRPDKGLPTLLAELRDLIVAYAKQETVEPLQRLGRFAKFGFAGSFLLGVGFLLLALAGLRALQQETVPHWTGNFTWVPYLITVAGSLLVAGLLGLRITADKRRAQRRRSAASRRKGV